MGKRILFVSPTGTLDNGAERSITNLMVYMSELGHTVANAFPQLGHDSADAYRRKLEMANISLFPLAIGKWWWPEAPGESGLTKESQNYFYQNYVYDLRQIIREQAIEIVVSNTANVFAGAVAAACEGIPHVWLIHEFPRDEFAYYGEKLPFMLENSEKVFAVAGSLSKELTTVTQNHPKLASFIPYSDVELVELRDGEGSRIVSIGQINTNKNQLELLAAYQRLGRYDIPLVFIGDWDESIKLEMDAVIANEQMTNVQFVGYQASPWQLVQSTDICVFPSQMESFSLVFMEAILNGVPTIVSDNPGYTTVRELFGAGTVYRLGQIQDLADAISYQLDHFDTLKKEATQQGQQAREKYTLAESYKELIATIENLPTHVEKPLRAIETLLGHVAPQIPLEMGQQERVTFYFASGQEPYSEENSWSVGFEKEGTVQITVPDTATQLRIDLTEKTGYFQVVTLTDDIYNTELLPIGGNAIQDGNAYYFLTDDPQLEYHIENYRGQTLTLTYQQANTAHPEDDTYLLKDVIVKQKKEKESRLELDRTVQKQSQQIDALTREVERLQESYNRVVGSRRWRYPSKIIDGLRRQK